MVATWRLVNKRVSAHRDPIRYQFHIQRLGRAINAILKEDRRRRTEEEDNEVDRLLGEDPPFHWEACHRMKGWYLAVVDRTPLPDWVTLERITAERVNLYRHIPHPGENTPISIDILPVEDSVTTEDKIEWEV